MYAAHDHFKGLYTLKCTDVALCPDIRTKILTLSKNTLKVKIASDKQSFTLLTTGSYTQLA